jgi:hypothetical protein
MKQYFKVLIVLGAMFAAAGPAVAAKLKLPEGMGGVPDIGAIPCSVLTKMLVVGPKGTRLSLLTWANGYYYATYAATTEELLDAAESAGESWDFDRLTDHLVGFCAKNEDALTREAVIDLGEQLVQ